MKSHHELRAWQSADEVAFRVFKWSDATWSARRSVIYDQLRRAALSVALNIAEGYASGPGARCRSHLRIAYASAVETTAVLEFCLRLGEDVGEIKAKSEETQALTYRLWQRSRKK